jgi:hypothetical protein
VAFFGRLMEIQLASPAFVGAEVEYHPKVSSLLTEAYFAITDAYKRIFLNEGRRTEVIKQAALTCAVISAIQPLRPKTTPVDDDRLLYINPMFAMRAACAIIDHPFHLRGFDNQRRFYVNLSSLSLPCLAPMIDEANDNDFALTTLWKLELSPEEIRELNHIISLFSVLYEMKIFKKKDK